MTTQLNWASIEPAAAVATPSPSAIAARAPGASPHHEPSSTPGGSTETVHPAAAENSIATLQAVAEQLAAYLERNACTVNFTVDEQSGRAIITVRSAKTGEVIRQIPSEEALRLAEALSDGSRAFIDLIA